jgi:hypothetical protein
MLFALLEDVPREGNRVCVQGQTGCLAAPGRMFWHYQQRRVKHVYAIDHVCGARSAAEDGLTGE